MERNWLVREAPPEAVQKELADYPDLLQQLLYGRGITKREQAEIFLNPDYERDLPNPFLLKDMERAVARVGQAIKQDERLVIFADYDADGVTAAVILSEFFRQIGFSNFEVYIPDRNRDSHGLSPEAVRRLIQSGARLIITVDCGISNVKEVALANSLGAEVIITDHHLPPPDGVLPSAYAIVDPKLDSPNGGQAGGSYPDKMICGAAVAFKLVQGLLTRFSPLIPTSWEKWLLDLVALATISDMVPLKNENRTLVHFGLKVLRQSRRVGLQTLFSALRLNSRFLNEDDIGFILGPRINAASRMSHASDAYFLLATRDPAEAEVIVRHLEVKNSERQRIVDEMVSVIDRDVQTGGELPPVIVRGDFDWLPSGLGLAAGRLSEKYRRPVFLWAGTGNASGLVKGSARSGGQINLVNLMQAAGGEEFFAEFGGHAAAAGFSLAGERLPELTSRLLQALTPSDQNAAPPDLIIDAPLALSQVNEETWRFIEQISPFGQENPKPIFLFAGLEIARVRTFGNGGLHLSIFFKSRSQSAIPALGFFNGRSGFANVVLESGRRVDLAATIDKTYFRGSPELRLRIVDLRPAK